MSGGLELDETLARQLGGYALSGGLSGCCGCVEHPYIGHFLRMRLGESKRALLPRETQLTADGCYSRKP
jgi:hypothetical protein